MNKSDYVLILFYRLMSGERIKKNLFMQEFGVGRRSFDRYIQAVRLMLSDVYSPNELCYDAKNNEYYLSGLTQSKLHGIKILPLVILMFESESMTADDSLEVLTELLEMLPRNEKIILQRTVKRLSSIKILESGNSILKLIWDLNLLIESQKKIFLTYENVAREEVLPKELSCTEGEWILKGSTDSGLEKSFLIRKICKIENV